MLAGPEEQTMGTEEVKGSHVRCWAYCAWCIHLYNAIRKFCELGHQWTEPTIHALCVTHEREGKNGLTLQSSLEPKTYPLNEQPSLQLWNCRGWMKDTITSLPSNKILPTDRRAINFLFGLLSNRACSLLSGFRPIFTLQPNHLLGMSCLPTSQPAEKSCS